MKLTVKSYDIKKDEIHGSANTAKRKLLILLFSLAGILILAAGAVFAAQWLEGEKAAKNAQALLNESRISEPQPIKPASIDYTLESSSSDLVQPTSPSSPDENTSVNIPDSLEGYTVIARLDVSSLDIHLPVLSETSKDALKVSVCCYSEPDAGEDGNLVITGHNYNNGAHFGTLDKISIGDHVTLTDQSGQTYVYTVYETDHIKPDEPQKLDDTEYQNELTLLTCESHGNRRLVVRCKAMF